MDNQPLFSGLIAPPHTPFDGDDKLNLEVVERQAEHFRDTGVTGVFVAGSTGECQSLTIDERLALAAAWVEAAKPRELKVIIQVGDNCQANARRLAAHAREIGADAVAAHAPCYFKPATVADLIDFLEPIATEAGELPFYFYDIPVLTEVRLSMVDLLTEGKSRMPNLAGLKYTNIDLMQLQECVQLNGASFNILFGCDEALLAGIALGAHGAVGTSYNFAAPLFNRVIDGLRSGDVESARAEQAKAVEMIGIFKRYGFAAAAKAVMAMIGIDCGPVRPPLRSLTLEQVASLRRELEQAEMFDAWYPRETWQPIDVLQRQTEKLMTEK